MKKGLDEVFKDILFPVDLDEKSSWEKAIPTIVEYSQAFKSCVHILTVVPDYGMSLVGQFFPSNYEGKVLDAANKRLHEFVKEHIPAGIKVQHIIGQGTIYEVILDMANEIDADLIVMTSHRPELRDYLLGPNASRVVRHANQSVLVIRP